jgi:acylphosphatase
LVGWVRNQFDGTVEVEAAGDDALVDALVTWLKHGPPSARVTGVDIVKLAAGQMPVGFDIR